MEFLVYSLELGEITFDPIEHLTVWQIEDLSDVDFIKQMLRIMRLMKA
jgi:hypothetical protein